MSGFKDLPQEVKEHAHRVGLLSRYTARALGKDERAAYLAGIFHDTGKSHVPPDLLTGREITSEEYERIKEHATAGYEELKNHMPFCALVAGLHHEVALGTGYGITLDSIPDTYSFHDLKKLLDITTIVSIADFADAWDRGTKSYSVNKDSITLEEALLSRFPNEVLVVKSVLDVKNAEKEAQYESR